MLLFVGVFISSKSIKAYEMGDVTFQTRDSGNFRKGNGKGKDRRFVILVML